MTRFDGRTENEQIREVKITRNFTKYAEGSVLIEMGETKVICNASVENGVPYFLRGQGQGWLTAEYSMLPRATQDRNTREAARRKLSGRTQEIQRLIGRALRSVVDLDMLGERTIWVDCDVIQADGGTRTASITGAFVALYDAFNYMREEEMISELPCSDFIAAISVGVVNDEVVADLCYGEDSSAKVDLNLVMTEQGEIIEIQGTGEENPFTQQEMMEMMKLGQIGIKQLVKQQKDVLADVIKAWQEEEE